MTISATIPSTSKSDKAAPARGALSSSSGLLRGFAAIAVLLALVLPRPAQAVDGCLVLLCLAAPSWKNIVQCVDPVRSVLRDLARGRPFPSCGMSGAGNGAGNRWSSPPDYCPAQYTSVTYLESGVRYGCDYDAAVEVSINGSVWTRTWWRMSGDSITEYTPAAKAQLGTWDTRFDDDYAAWLAAQPPVPPEPMN